MSRPLAYEAQEIVGQGERNTSYRITHVASDSRIATSYDPKNAKLVVDALNAHDPEGKRYP